METSAGGDPARLAAEAASAGAAAVVACGGDGTLNGVLNGLAAAGASDVVVGVIPAGTANVWAREAHVPRDPAGALRLLDEGQVMRTDLGQARLRGEERRFLLMCGVGIDAAVVAAVEARPALKRRAAQGAFAIAGAGVLASGRPVRVTLDDGRHAHDLSLLLLVAGNTRLYGGVTPLASGACADDGLLDVLAFEVRGGWRRFADSGRHLLGAMRRLRSGWAGTHAERFLYVRSGHVRLQPERALPVQLDGEPFAWCGPEAPLDLSVERGAVQMLIAPGTNPLFGAPPVRRGA